MTATYRLQLTPAFGFAEVEALLPYFRRLGVSHLYLSPISEARAGSTHGYDVIDHNAVREDFGGRAGFEALAAAAHDAGLGLVLDWVPNHAGVGPQNAAWQDVLAYGPYSPFARYFDLDWNPIKPELHGKLLLPFLGSPYGEAFDGGELGLAYADGRLHAAYYDQRYALSPATYGPPLDLLLGHFERTETYFDLKDLRDAYASLAEHERERAEGLRPRLAAVLDGAPDDELDGALAKLEPDDLHRLLERQHWRLAEWRTAGAEINYRRFFDINGLAGLRMEDPPVFWASHKLLGELLALDGVDGVRIDHVDGLFDPQGYLERLRELGAEHVYVEKILAHGETLPEAWPVEGTTGYVFMNDALHLLADPDALEPLARTYRRFVPDVRPWEHVVYRSKQLVMATTLSNERNRLGTELDRLSEADYRTRDFTLEALREALAEVVAAFDRYRTYLPHEPDEAAEVVHEAVVRARRRNPAVEPSVFAFVERVLVGELRADLENTRRRFVGRFQQYTAPVAAKGVEDTAFYRWPLLTAFNEVGGEPEPFAIAPQVFHAHNRFRAFRYPRHLLATATHDHKRGEDTRMRILALAEVPDAWESTVGALGAIAEPHRGLAAPSRADEYFFYQHLAALWPERDAPASEGGAGDLADRLAAYMQKVAREAKMHTSWINPDEDYEAALEALVRGVVADDATPAALDALADEVAALGFHHSVSQLVMKMTAPGVPDVYQGTERLDLSLVDPDNRRPVDYDDRQRLLDDLGPLLDAPDPEPVAHLLATDRPRFKAYVLAQLLRLRNAHAELFEGTYTALDLDGDASDLWIAYAREPAGPASENGDGPALVVCASRYPSRWPDHREASLTLPDHLAGRAWTEALSGHAFEEIGTLFMDTLPLRRAVLVSEGA